MGPLAIIKFDVHGNKRNEYGIALLLGSKDRRREKEESVQESKER